MLTQVSSLCMEWKRDRHKPISAKPVLEWLKEHRADGWNQSKLAVALNVGPQHITNWKRRGIPYAELPNVCEIIGMSIDEYLRRVGRLPKSQRKGYASAIIETKRVRLLSWHEVGQINKLAQPKQGAGAFVTTTAEVGRDAFALRVIGDSMEPRIPDGSVVIIDPEREPKAGSILLVKLPDDDQALLRQLGYDGAKQFLRPLNNRYPIIPMPAGAKILGVAVKVELDL